MRSYVNYAIPATIIVDTIISPNVVVATDEPKERKEKKRRRGSE